MSANSSNTKLGLSKTAKSRTDRQWIEGLLVTAQEREWFGSITIELKRGVVDVAKLVESMKPPKVSS